MELHICRGRERKYKQTSVIIKHWKKCSRFNILNFSACLPLTTFVFVIALKGREACYMRLFPPTHTSPFCHSATHLWISSTLTIFFFKFTLGWRFNCILFAIILCLSQNHDIQTHLLIGWGGVSNNFLFFYSYPDTGMISDTEKLKSL